MEEFNVWKVLVMVGISLVLAGFEIWFLAGFVQLPVAQIIDDAPRYIFAFFQTMLVVLSGLLTYKLLTFHITDTSTFLPQWYKLANIYPSNLISPNQSAIWKELQCC